MIKSIIKLLATLVYKIYRLEEYYNLRKLYYFLYTNWIRHAFKAVGMNPRFEPFSLLKGADKISIGNNVKIAKGCFLTTWNTESSLYIPVKIHIGNNVNIGAYCHFSSVTKISIGNGVLLGKWVTITDNNHGNTDMETLLIAPDKRPVVSKAGIKIEENVWIGDKVTILAGVSVGQGAVIAANSVVTKNVPPFSVAAGVPAKIIKDNH